MRDLCVKNILTILFVFVLATGFVKNGSWLQLDKIFSALMQTGPDEWNIRGIEDEYASSMWKHKELIDLNGSVLKRLEMSGFYNDIGIYVNDNGYMISDAERTTTDYEYEQIAGLKEFLDERGLSLLYVNKPTKYLDDNIFEEKFGVESYCNRNADLFISRIRNAGIPAVDLRENIRDEDLNIENLFYRTDHHWTTRTGLWAVQRIAQGLNEYCGYDIDTGIFDIDNYQVNKWDDCWLGEQGGKIGESYAGLDGFEEIKPAFDTDYTFMADDGSEYAGTFDSFLDEAYYLPENNLEHNLSWHYSYKSKSCINNNVDKGRILMLGDSYDMVTEPFLSLGVHEIDIIDLRQVDEGFNLRDYIDGHDFDTVVICYAQFMIGAHDDPESSNYRVFSFE